MIDEYVDKRQKASELIKSTRYAWAPRAIYALAVILVCLVGAVTLCLINPFETDFIVNTLMTLLPSTAVFASFTVIYKWKETEESEIYRSWNVKWTTQSNRVRDEKRQGAFVKYCERKTEEEREEIFRSRLENALISFEDYKSTYAQMTRKELAAEKKAGRISARQKRVLLSLRKPIRVKPVQPMLILRGVECHSANDAGRRTGKGASWSVVIRVIFSLALVIAASSVMPKAREDFALLPYITTLVVRLISITASAFAGAYNGIAIVSDTCQMMKARTMYIESFLEECE